MAFKLKSGNRTSFKNMGSAPFKHKITNPETGNTSIYHDHPEPKGKPPGKQRLVKEGEGQDQNKIFDAKGNHIGNYVDGKKVMFNDKPTTDPKMSTKSVHGQLNDAKKEFEAEKNRKKSPTKQKKASYKNTVEDHTNQSPYWYKIDGKPVSKYVYNKYKNKPGQMEGGGKTTNDPDAAGLKAQREKDREKLRKPTVLTEQQTKNLKNK